MPPYTEIEIKLAVADAGALPRQLAALGLRRSSPRQHEMNWILDDARASLRRQGRTLRLRRRGRGSRAAWLLTAKGPARAGRYKVRPEAELALREGAEVLPLLELAGMRPQFVYERFRTIYRDRAGEAVVDETPIGTFLELEGPRAWIDRMARGLGFAPGDYITKTYAGLFRAFARRHRLPADAFTFAALRRPRR